MSQVLIQLSVLMFVVSALTACQGVKQSSLPGASSTLDAGSETDFLSEDTPPSEITGNSGTQRGGNQNGGGAPNPIGTSTCDRGIRCYLIDLYRNLLRRNADTAGLNYWISRYDSGELGCKAITLNFILSQEFAQTRNSALVGNFMGPYLSSMYLGVLGRELDQAGFQFWTQQLAAGYGVPRMELAFLASEEFNQRCAKYQIKY